MSKYWWNPVILAVVTQALKLRQIMYVKTMKIGCIYYISQELYTHLTPCCIFCVVCYQWLYSYTSGLLYYHRGLIISTPQSYHDDVIKWKHFLRYWPLWGESTGHRWIPLTKASDANFDVFFALRLKNDWANNRDVGNLRHHQAHYDVTVMIGKCMMWVQ